MKTKNKMKKKIVIEFNIVVVIGFLFGVFMGILLGMLIQQAIISESIMSFFDKVNIENLNFEFNQTKLVEDVFNYVK